MVLHFARREMILATSLLFSFLLDVLPTPDSLEIKIYFLNEFKMSEKCLSKVCDDVNHDLVMTRVRNSSPLFWYFTGHHYGMDV